MTWRAADGSRSSNPAFTAKNLIIPFSTDSQTFFQRARTALELATDSCNFSGCLSLEWMKGWNNSDAAVCKCRAGEGAIPPLLKTRNEIQLTNCFLAAAAAAAAAAAFVSRQMGGGTEERCEGTKFAFGTRNSV